VVDALYGWSCELHPQLVPKTPLYEAATYALNQEQRWRRCFTAGRFEIDNGEVERRLRRVAVGRKNYLFAGSDKGPSAWPRPTPCSAPARCKASIRWLGRRM
jgi:hypothetical protein